MFKLISAVAAVLVVYGDPRVRTRYISETHGDQLKTIQAKFSSVSEREYLYTK